MENEDLMRLDPEDLLSFFKSIKCPDDIQIISVDKRDADKGYEESGNIPFYLVINNMLFTSWVFVGHRDRVAAYYYCFESPNAMNIVRKRVAEEWTGYWDEYSDFIYCDTGYKINEEFKQLLDNEVERIFNLFE